MWKRKPALAPLDKPVVVVAAADDNYAMPLAVTIRSAIDTLRRGQAIVVNILDGGILPGTKERLARSWQAPHVSLRWLSPPIERIRDLKTENHLNLVTYLRINGLVPPSSQPRQ